MTEAPEDEDSPISEAEALALLEQVSRRVAAAFGAPDAAGEILAAVSPDEAAVELLRAAYESGRTEAAAAIALRGDFAGAPDWSDVESLGERRAIAREESICGRCANSAICAVARAAPQELLIVISRCLAFRAA